MQPRNQNKKEADNFSQKILQTADYLNIQKNIKNDTKLL